MTAPRFNLSDLIPLDRSGLCLVRLNQARQAAAARTIIGTFAIDGPEKCSGLPGYRYRRGKPRKGTGRRFRVAGLPATGPFHAVEFDAALSVLRFQANFRRKSPG